MTSVKLKDYSYNGMNAKVYIPENINENTDFFVFVHGGKEMNYENRYNDWNSLINNQLSENGCDSIVVMPTMTNRWDERWSSNTVDIVEKIQTEYGVKNDNITSCGFSFGGWGAARTTIENIKRNPDMDPQVLFMLDDYGKSTQNTNINILGEGGQEALLQNDSIIFSYVNSGVPNGKVTDKTRELDILAESGVNLVRVVCDKGGHQEIKNNFFKNGMADYSNGNAVLPDNGYTYQRANVSVDPKSGKKTVVWEKINVDDINTKTKLYNYFDINKEDIGKDFSPIINPSLSSPLLGSSMYADLDLLQQWRNKLDLINDECIEQLNIMLATISSLEDCWVGNISSGFVEDSSSMVRNVLLIHDSMKNALNPLLTDVVELAKNM